MTACLEKDQGFVQIDFASAYPEVFKTFSETMDLNNVYYYENQAKPFYINRDNTNSNAISNAGALLGRVLFYDTNLSSDRSVSCSSCHSQAAAFGDTNQVSLGVNGFTGRHSMRLVNARFSDEEDFFWDERAPSLEFQATQPIRNHEEMGFSGSNGDPDFDDLISRLEAIPYYLELFDYAFGSSEVTEAKMQLALAQFIRSIQSFDSKYDIGRQSVRRDTDSFPNFTADENAGKLLFMRSVAAGGANCASCHQPPEFSIRRDSGNNGAIGVFGSFSTDLSITKSPSLRDLVKPDGSSNGAFMHDGSLESLEEVVEHYNSQIVNNSGLDRRLRPNGVTQRLGLTATEKAQLVLFMRTLSGTDIYNNEKWSDPFN